MAETLYQVIVRDTSGDQVAIFAGAGRGDTGGGMQAFSYRKRLRTPGSWWMQVAGDDERIDLIELNDGLNYIFEFWRRDPVGGLDWYRDFSGLHRFDNFRQVAEGRQIYVARGRGLNDLLGGEPVRYDAGTTEAEKSGPCETVAKEYVDENLGPSAPAARQLANFTVQADLATGATWGGDRANKQLFDVLVELADFAPGDFNVVDLSTINQVPDFEFRWADNQWGLDKTEGNTAGNPPVIFGVQRRNATNVDYTHSRLDEVNVVYVGGKNFRGFRKVRTRTASDVGLDTTWDTTNWGRRAVFRGTQDNADSDMDDKADETLYKLRPRTTFMFATNISANTRYGRDWDYGDLVTVEHRGRSIDQKIVGVIVAVGMTGEVTITPETEDWYG
jgi:hypothetical protein